jgi:hypothetical protein
VGREGIEPPQSKTADLQSAELTTSSTYQLLRSTGGALPTEREYSDRPIGGSTTRVRPREQIEFTPHRPSPRMTAGDSADSRTTRHEEQFPCIDGILESDFCAAA